MAYSEEVAQRIRSALRRRRGITEKKMFGGIAFMLNGNMCCGVVSDTLMLRLGEDGAASALNEPHTREMDFTGKPMKTMVYVDPPGFHSDEALSRWLECAVNFAKTLPKK